MVRPLIKPKTLYSTDAHGEAGTYALTLCPTNADGELLTDALNLMSNQCGLPHNRALNPMSDQLGLSTWRLSSPRIGLFNREPLAQIHPVGDNPMTKSRLARWL